MPGLIKNSKCQYDAVIELGAKEIHKKFLKAVLCKLGMAATVYDIWHQRNAGVYRGHIKSEDSIITSIM